MGAALATENCENCCRVVTRMASSEMQKKVVGMRACAKEASDPPEVWVEILEMVFREDGHASFDPRKFSLTGLKVKTRVEITGTKAEIVKEVAADAAGQAAATFWEKTSSMTVPAAAVAAELEDTSLLLVREVQEATSLAAVRDEALEENPVVPPCAVRGDVLGDRRRLRRRDGRPANAQDARRVRGRKLYWSLRHRGPGHRKFDNQRVGRLLRRRQRSQRSDRAWI